MKRYNPKSIEKKWQKAWEQAGVNKTEDSSTKPKFYILDMFPYPSGEALHVGHPKGYIASDVVARFKRMNGFNVLHPMGWDAFGLPAENYAIKNKVNPNIAVKLNIKKFKKQLSLIGFNYDWSREINTTDPNYYKWTQWIFLQLFKKGLAYESNEPINWCPSCKTGLANEDLENGKCERCSSDVEKKPMRQWVLKITEYADRLIKGLDTLDWPEPVKVMQKNWIGRSEGANVVFPLFGVPGQEGGKHRMTVFTTRPDTLFGATYLAISAELAKKWIDIGWKADEPVKQFIEKTLTEEAKRSYEEPAEKEGVFTGLYAENPVNKEKVPVWIANYVLSGYGTGAIMAVPAHDERDFEFAIKYQLPIKGVIRKSKETLVKFIIRSLTDNWKEKLSETGFKYKQDESSIVISIPDEKVGSFIPFGQALLKEGPYYYSLRNNSKHVVYKDKAFDIYSPSQDKEAKLYGRHLLIPEKELEWSGPFIDDGEVVNSGEFNGLNFEIAKIKITEWLEQNGHGKKAVTYRLKDWVFSRQRYWGEPIPVVHCKKCGNVPVPENELPLTLPNVRSYEPTGTGESPLANIKKWVNTKCPQCGGRGKRETNTMPQWAGSSWYYFRYVDPQNNNAFIDAEKEKQWIPVDVYVGGDHATRHLIYARFWHKFLFDIGVAQHPEPFKRLEYLGMILASDGRKMSKRWGNVINPDDIITQYGADTLRLYEMFMGPFEGSVAWNTESMIGVRRFLDRAWKIVLSVIPASPPVIPAKAGIQKQKQTKKDLNSFDVSVSFLDSGSKAGMTEERGIRTLTHQTIKKITEDIENFRFNTCVSQLMILVNDFEKTAPSNEEKIVLVKLLSPFAPHIAEELWHQIPPLNPLLRKEVTEKLSSPYEGEAKGGVKRFIVNESWPTYDESKLLNETVTISVQFNGKFRGTILTPRGATQDEVLKLVHANEKLNKYLTGEPKKLILVPDRLLNILL